MVEETEIIERLTAGLNEGQKETFLKIIAFLEGEMPADAFVLMGYAGTGKTYLVKRVVMWINATQKTKTIAITAPTNKAVRVLETMGGFESESVAKEKDDLFDMSSSFINSIQYCTIHKLLGLKEVITAKGEQLFKNDRMEKNDITKYRYLIVDECSMLNDNLCKDIMKFSDKVKILYMGDPAQIPPVKRKDCIPFREDHGYNFERATLTEIMRQKGDHPIVDASFELRNNLKTAQPLPVLQTKLNDSGHGIVFYHALNDRDSVRPMLKKYFDTDEFKADPNYAKVIAWTNAVVNYMNRTVREIMYGDDAEEFVIGEKLIAAKPIFGQFGIVFNTSDEMEVVDVKLKDKKFSLGRYKMEAKVYDLKVEYVIVGTGQKIKKTIEVIHGNDFPEYMKIVNESKKLAANQQDLQKAKRMWVMHYDILKWSAPVAYNYAITAHKAQGSTYENVLLIEENLDKNPNIVERNRIKYTAYSRASNKLFILRGNYD